MRTECGACRGGRPIPRRTEGAFALFREENVGSWMWGLVNGRTQTNLLWSTMGGGKSDPSPVLWQHDLFYPDGTPYREEEIRLFRGFTGRD